MDSGRLAYVRAGLYGLGLGILGLLVVQFEEQFCRKSGNF